jgi:hypothetical protein
MSMRVLSAVCLIFWLTGSVNVDAGLKTVNGRSRDAVRSGVQAEPGADKNTRAVEENDSGRHQSSAEAADPDATRQTESAPVTSAEGPPVDGTLSEPRAAETPKGKAEDVDPLPGEPAGEDRSHPEAPGTAEGTETPPVPVPGPARIGGTPQPTVTTGFMERPADPLPVLETEYVKALAGLTPGHNDSNPVWSPSGTMLAFERSIGDKREIIVVRRDGTLVQKIYCRLSEGEDEMDFLLPGIINSTSYNSGLTWSADEKRLVFMSNGGSGNYDLYLLPTIGNERTLRLTEHPQKDSHPHWSPMSDRLVFVSGRGGTADVFIMALTSRRLTRLTNGGKTNLYPQWSPDGQKIAWIYGSNENHDIHLIADIQRPHETRKTLIHWSYDDLRPVWSPDGTKIAFYSNYNLQEDPKIWSIVVVTADGTDPGEGPGLAEKVVARNVIPDIERGPAWMPDSRRIIYVKNDEQTYNPLFLVDIEKKHEVRINTGTRMNHDVVCAADGTFAFRAQTEQWDHIYLAKLKE